MTPRTLRRLHVWLGWLVGVPLLFWTVSGLWMVARPIDEVRGTALRRDPVALVLPAQITPPRVSKPFRSLALEPRAGGPEWIAKFTDGTVARAAATSGAWLPPITAAEALAIARAAYARPAAATGVRRFAADAAPIDLRQARPSWQVEFADATRVYVDADSGSVLALRTRQWRTFDWMWGLHIMDLGEREDTSHAILIVFAAMAMVTVLLALILLPLSARRRR